MAKRKSKRPNLSAETLERARAELRGDLPETPVVVAPASNGSAVSAAPKPKRSLAASPATRRIPSIEELIKEYHYVLVDLRNLAILAVILFVAIIAAAILIPRPTG